MKITLLYFAKFADLAAKTTEERHIDSSSTLSDVYRQLQSEYKFDLDPAQVRVAINDEFGDWNDTLHEGDTLAFIPPVAGG